MSLIQNMALQVICQNGLVHCFDNANPVKDADGNVVTHFGECPCKELPDTHHVAFNIYERGYVYDLLLTEDGEDGGGKIAVLLAPVCEGNAALKKQIKITLLQNFPDIDDVSVAVAKSPRFVATQMARHVRAFKEGTPNPPFVGGLSKN